MNGKILNERYEIQNMIDAGGMGLVYKAIDLHTGHEVALKILKPENAQNREYVQRFKKEAAAASSLVHKNIVRVLGSGEDGSTYYIVQEYVKGKTLKNLILDNGAIEYPKAVRMMVDICSAMEYAHDKGLIHRDIKPQNILVDQKGNIKITDFGIAKDITSTTLTGMDVGIMGSVHYFSPEQAKGEKVDERSDIYSLGIVFYEMVTGLLPFDGDTSIAVAIKHINNNVPPPREVSTNLPKSINDMILKATRKDRELRYQSAGEFKTDLIHALVKPGGNFVQLKPDEEGKRIRKEKNRPKRNIIFLLLMTFLILAILGTVFLMASYLFFGSKQDTTQVPNLAGMTEVDALSESAKIGLKIEKQYEYSNKVKEGYVISQKPKAGETIAKEALITITISQGSLPFEVPSIVDMTLDQAQAKLKDSGLKLGEVSYEESDKPEGYIISQLPESGVTITKGESVAVVVSGVASEKNVIVPLLTGSALETAANALKNAGIARFMINEEESDKDEGTVLNQTPVEGIQQQAGDPVTVSISAYKKKPYKASTKITADPSADDIIYRVVIEQDIGGEKAQFIVYEGPRPVGLELDLKAREKGEYPVVLYAGSKELRREVLTFK